VFKLFNLYYCEMGVSVLFNSHCTVDNFMLKFSSNVELDAALNYLCIRPKLRV